MFGPGVSLSAIDDGSKRAGDDDSFHRWCVCFNGLKYSCGAVDSGIEKVFLGVGDVEVEGGGRVDYGFETIDLQGVVESSFDGDVGDDFEGEFGGGGIWVSILDGVGFLLGADGGYYFVTMLEENVEDVCGDEARTTWFVKSVLSGLGVERV
jgi:hypothetical protein